MTPSRGVEPLSGQDAFLEALRPRLMAVLRGFRVPPEDAEDLLQQALLALVYRSETVRDPQHWLVGVLKRKCLMYWRSRRRRRDEAVDEETLEWLAEPTEPAQEMGDLARDLESLLARLPQRHQRLLRLRFWFGLEPQEVAAHLGYRPSSIGKITSRCLAVLSAEASAAGLAPPSAAFPERGNEPSVAEGAAGARSLAGEPQRRRKRRLPPARR